MEKRGNEGKGGSRKENKRETEMEKRGVWSEGEREQFSVQEMRGEEGSSLYNGASLLTRDFEPGKHPEPV